MVKYCFTANLVNLWFFKQPLDPRPFRLTLNILLSEIAANPALFLRKNFYGGWTVLSVCSGDAVGTPRPRRGCMRGVCFPASVTRRLFFLHRFNPPFAPHFRTLTDMLNSTRTDVEI